MVRVQMLGDFKIVVNERELRLPTAKIGLLAAYLFWRKGAWVRRETLRGLIWGETDEDRAAMSLRTAIYSLKKGLDAAGCPSAHIVDAQRDVIRIRPEAQVIVDAHIFSERATLQHAWDGSELDSIIGAAALYAGDFLSCYDADWCIIERKRLADLHLGLLRVLVERLSESNLFQAAVPYAKRWCESDPLDEEAYRSLMTLYCATGQHARASDIFWGYKHFLESEFGLSPSERTEVHYKTLGLPERPASGHAGLVQLNADTSLLAARVRRQFSANPLRNAGFLLVYGEDLLAKGRLKEALQAINRAIAIYDAVGTEEDQARSRMMLAETALFNPHESRPQKALEVICRALDYYRAKGPSSDLCRALMIATHASSFCLMTKEARELGREGLASAEHINDTCAAAHFWAALALNGVIELRLEEAEECFGIALGASSCFKRSEDMLRLVLWRGIHAVVAGQLETAERFLREALEMTRNVTKSPVIQQTEYTLQSFLLLTLHFMDKRHAMRALLDLPDAEKYDPMSYLTYVVALLFAEDDKVAAIKDTEAWLRSGMKTSLPPILVPGFIRHLVEDSIHAGLVREASVWSSVGIRLARTHGWTGYEAIFCAYRAVALAKRGLVERALLYCARSHEKMDPGDRWTPAVIAWARALTAAGRGDTAQAIPAYARCVELFQGIGSHYHIKRIANELERLNPEDAPLFIPSE